MTGTTTHPGATPTPTRPPLVVGVNHIAVNTADLDRFRRFYQGVLGLRLVLVGRLDHPPFLRHCALAVTDAQVLHAFEVPGYDPEADGIGTDIGQRGRIDHFGFLVADEHALAEVATGLVAAGASDGAIQALGPVLSVFARDPDGLAFEVNCPHPDLTEADLAPEIIEAGEPGWLDRMRAAAQAGRPGAQAGRPGAQAGRLAAPAGTAEAPGGTAGATSAER